MNLCVWLSLRVVTAAGLNGRINTLNASVLWIDHKAGRAEFADGLVLFDVTRPVFWTGRILARIAALVVDTGHVGWTTPIPQTDRDGSRAVFDADANSPVVQHLADFVGSRARVACSSARILATTYNASQVASALVVHSAFDRVRSARHFAGFVQHETVFTDADGPVSSNFASFALIASDIFEIARVLTSAQIGIASVIG